MLEYTASNEKHTVLTTKLTVPSVRPNMVPRNHLKSLLANSCKTRLTIVVAPAGWGKSSAVIQWCTTDLEPETMAWISLDFADNDPSRFFIYFFTALSRFAPVSGEQALTLLQSPNHPSYESLLTLLLNSIGAVENHFTIILDDYHIIETREIHDAMTFLVDHLPSNLHLVLASRSDPPLPLSRLRAGGQLNELRAGELRFNADEAVLFFHHVMRLNLNDEAVGTLLTRTEGWIAGLQLAALSMQSKNKIEDFIESFNGTHRYIVDYLMDEVLSAQPDHIQAFLLQTSILTRLNASLCDSVTQKHDSKEILGSLDSSNLFLITLDDERRWYRYHHLFADVLQARLHAVYPDDIRHLHQRASDWYASHEIYEDAVQHALFGADYDNAAELLRKCGPDMWRTGKHKTLEYWINLFPADVLIKHPGLMLCLGQCHLINNRYMEAVKIIDECGKVMTDDDPEVYCDLLMMQAYIARINGDYPLSEELSLKALDIMPDDEEWSRAYTLINLAHIYFYNGDMESCYRSIAEVESIRENIKDIHVDMFIRHTRAEILEQYGELSNALSANQAIIADLNALGVTDIVEYMIAVVAVSRIAYERNDLNMAEAMLDSLGHLSDHFFGAKKLLSQARIYYAQGRHSEAMNCLDSINAVVSNSSAKWIHNSVDTMRIKMAPETINTDKWLESYEANRSDYICTEEDDCLIWACLKLQAGDENAVIQHLLIVLNGLVAAKRHGIALPFRLVLSAAYYRLNDNENAINMLLPALELSHKEGYLRSYIDLGETLIPMLTYAYKRNIESDYICKIMDALGVEITAKTANTAKPADSPLSSREIEVLHLIAAGLSNPEIAEKLFLSVGTVKRHVFNIFTKLDTTSRIDTISKAREIGLLK